jgi:hypothetical protein
MGPEAAACWSCAMHVYKYNYLTVISDSRSLSEVMMIIHNVTGCKVVLIKFLLEHSCAPDHYQRHLSSDLSNLE